MATQDHRYYVIPPGGEDAFGYDRSEAAKGVAREYGDGAHVVDIDKDGDQDIVSIGWSHNRVLLYENLALTRLPPEVYVPLVGRNR